MATYNIKYTRNNTTGPYRPTASIPAPIRQHRLTQLPASRLKRHVPYTTPSPPSRVIRCARNTCSYACDGVGTGRRLGWNDESKDDSKGPAEGFSACRHLWHLGGSSHGPPRRTRCQDLKKSPDSQHLVCTNQCERGASKLGGGSFKFKEGVGQRLLTGERHRRRSLKGIFTSWCACSHTLKKWLSREIISLSTTPPCCRQHRASNAKTNTRVNVRVQTHIYICKHTYTGIGLPCVCYAGAPIYLEHVLSASAGTHTSKCVYGHAYACVYV